jgi:hypothetical protein
MFIRFVVDGRWEHDPNQVKYEIISFFIFAVLFLSHPLSFFITKKKKHSSFLLNVTVFYYFEYLNAKKKKTSSKDECNVISLIIKSTINLISGGRRCGMNN